MSKNRDDTAQASGEPRPVRTPPLFADFSRSRQVVTLLVVPVAFGVVMGLTLKWSQPAWWAIQAVGILGAFVAGRDHLRRRLAAVRGAVAGLLAGVAVVGIHATVPGNDAADFQPALFPAIATVASAAVHAAGVTLRNRDLRKQQGAR